MQFFNENRITLIQTSLKFVPQESNWQLLSIGSGIDFTPIRRRTITWADDDHHG